MLSDYLDKIICGDCLEVMKELPDRCVDAVVTDPPYGNGTQYLSYEDTKGNLSNLVRLFMPEALRIARGVFVTSGVANMWLYPQPTWTLAWVNPAGVGSSSWGFSCWQPILAYGKDPFLEDCKGRRSDVYFQKHTDKDKNEHPCNKPYNVMRWILERTTRSGAVILDPFLGSGTTAVACVETGRHFIGIELEEKYCEIARRRVAEATPSLFREGTV